MIHGKFNSLSIEQKLKVLRRCLECIAFSIMMPEKKIKKDKSNKEKEIINKICQDEPFIPSDYSVWSFLAAINQMLEGKWIEKKHPKLIKFQQTVKEDSTALGQLMEDLERPQGDIIFTALQVFYAFSQRAIGINECEQEDKIDVGNPILIFINKLGQLLHLGNLKLNDPVFVALKENVLALMISPVLEYDYDNLILWNAFKKEDVEKISSLFTPFPKVSINFIECLAKLAAEKNNPHLFSLLLRAPIFLLDENFYQNMREVAAEYGHFEMVQYIIQFSYDRDMECIKEIEIKERRNEEITKRNLAYLNQQEALSKRMTSHRRHIELAKILRFTPPSLIVEQPKKNRDSSPNAHRTKKDFQDTSKLEVQSVSTQPHFFLRK